MFEEKNEQNFDVIRLLMLQCFLTQKAVLTLKEAAAYTGRSTSNLYKLSSLGLIPHSKPAGKKIYFDRVKLEQWMLRNPIKTSYEIEAEAVSRVSFPKKYSKKVP